MEIAKLAIPGLVCPICNKKFVKTSSIVVVDRKHIIHANYSCFVIYFIQSQAHLPEGTRKDIFGKYDASFRFTEDYEKSEKSITEDEYKEYKKKFVNTYLMTEHVTVKKILRERIWLSVGKKYAKELQYLHALAKIYDNQKDKWREKSFKATFIPSVMEQFKARGYLSKKQWDLINQIVDANISGDDREFLWQSIENARDIDNLILPDKLRYLQRRKSFMKWYNQQEGIPEEE